MNHMNKNSTRHPSKKISKSEFIWYGKKIGVKNQNSLFCAFNNQNLIETIKMWFKKWEFIFWKKKNTLDRKEPWTRIHRTIQYKQVSQSEFILDEKKSKSKEQELQHYGAFITRFHCDDKKWCEIRTRIHYFMY